MPILGALAVINRIEKVMQEGFGLAVRTLEADLVDEGALSGSDPPIPIPTDLEYGRDEDPATDTVTSVITRCNSSEITNEPSNHGDLHWQHEVVVEVITVAEIIENERLFTSTHIYGAALVKLLGAVSPCLELGGLVTSSGSSLPLTSAGGGGNWPDEDNILLTDGVLATTTNRAVQNVIVPTFDTTGVVPSGKFIISGVTVTVRGKCEDADVLARELLVNIRSSGTPSIVSNLKTGTFSASPSVNTVSLGGPTDLWGLEVMDPRIWTDPSTIQVRVEAKNKDGSFDPISLDSVTLTVHYKVLETWGGSIVNNIGPVRYRNEFNEAGAFWIRSASVVMEVQRREING